MRSNKGNIRRRRTDDSDEEDTVVINSKLRPQVSKVKHSFQDENDEFEETIITKPIVAVRNPRIAIPQFNDEEDGVLNLNIAKSEKKVKKMIQAPGTIDVLRNSIEITKQETFTAQSDYSQEGLLALKASQLTAVTPIVTNQEISHATDPIENGRIGMEFCGEDADLIEEELLAMNTTIGIDTTRVKQAEQEEQNSLLLEQSRVHQTLLTKKKRKFQPGIDEEETDLYSNTLQESMKEKLEGKRKLSTVMSVLVEQEEELEGIQWEQQLLKRVNGTTMSTNRIIPSTITREGYNQQSTGDIDIFLSRLSDGITQLVASQEENKQSIEHLLANKELLEQQSQRSIQRISQLLPQYNACMELEEYCVSIITQFQGQLNEIDELEEILIDSCRHQREQCQESLQRQQETAIIEILHSSSLLASYDDYYIPSRQFIDSLTKGVSLPSERERWVAAQWSTVVARMSYIAEDSKNILYSALLDYLPTLPAAESVPILVWNELSAYKSSLPLPQFTQRLQSMICRLLAIPPLGNDVQTYQEELYRLWEEILHRMDDLRTITDRYTANDLSSSLPELLGPLLRSLLMLHSSQPASDSLSAVLLGNQRWYQLLKAYCLPAEPQLLHALLERYYLPWLTQWIESSYEPLNAIQSYQLSLMILDLYRHELPLSSLRIPLQAILSSCERSLTDLCLPMLPNLSQLLGETASEVLVSQLGLILKLLGNLYGYQSILSPTAIKLVCWKSLVEKLLDPLVSIANSVLSTSQQLQLLQDSSPSSGSGVAVRRLASMCVDVLYGVFLCVPLESLDIHRDRKYFPLNKLRDEVIRAVDSHRRRHSSSSEMSEEIPTSTAAAAAANREILMKLLAIKLK